MPLLPRVLSIDANRDCLLLPPGKDVPIASKISGDSGPRERARQADIIGKVYRKGLKVDDVMTHDVIVIDEEMPVEEIASLLTMCHIKRVPVASAGKLLGIVSRADIVRAIAEGHVILRNW